MPAVKLPFSAEGLVGELDVSKDRWVGGKRGVQEGKDVLIVKMIYNYLVERGLVEGEKIELTSVYDEKTEKAVRAIQSAVNEKTKMRIKIDGVFGIETKRGVIELLRIEKMPTPIAAQKFEPPKKFEPSILQEKPKKTEMELGEMWVSSGAEREGLSYEAFSAGMIAYRNGVNAGKIKNTDYFVIIDYSKPSYEKRFFLFNMKTGKLERTELVAHGKGSGLANVISVSNNIGSHKSSIGLFVTAETYTGKNGYSLRLDGLEIGYNSNARERNIVIHGADYVSEEMAQNEQPIGRSHGCPALPRKSATEIIDKIKDGAGVYIHLSSEYKRYAEMSYYQKPV
ncbi:MAG: murein L,D-transpeptidase catalytic domain family protein [Candidatus Micrarchaeia archaeon]